MLTIALGCSEGNMTILGDVPTGPWVPDTDDTSAQSTGSDSILILPDTSTADIGVGDLGPRIDDTRIDLLEPEKDTKPPVQRPDSTPATPEVTNVVDTENDTGPTLDTNPPKPSCVDEPVVVFQVYPRDIWAQPIDTAVVTLTDNNTGYSVQNNIGKPVAFALCTASEFTLDVSAPNYEKLGVQVSFDGFSEKTSLSISQPTTPVGYVYTSTVTPAGNLDNVRHFTLWTGLPHHYFAPTGFPTRHGTGVELYTNGDDAWNNLAIDLKFAESQVTMATWWWESDFEIARDSAVHIWLSSTDRWKTTIMARLESLWNVKRKVLVNQFFTQDGLLGQYNVDDKLVAKAKTPGDNFEYMGIANPIPSKFWATPGVVNYYSRLKAAVSGLNLETTALEWQGLKPFMTPVYVDTTALPLGLGYLDVSIASWHQKFVSIDGKIAYVGGMNTTAQDWDTKANKQYEPMRMNYEATTAARKSVALKKALPDYPATRDHMVRLEGPTATDVESVFGSLWKYQMNKGALYANLSTPAIQHTLAEPLKDGPNVVQTQLLFTVPKPFGEYSVLETLLRAISRAQTYIFIEDQYFRSPILTEALVKRMLSNPSLRLIVVTNPINEWKDLGCWHTYKQFKTLKNMFPSRFAVYKLMSFDAVDTGCILCIDEVEATFQPFYLHSKMVIIDDRYMEVGSANQNNRSMLYDAEMAVAVFDDVWVKKARDQVIKALLGQYFKANMTPAQLWSKMKAVAQANQSVYDYWNDQGFDLNLNGKPVPNNIKPKAPLYPLKFGSPNDCLLEGIGPDVI